MELKRVVVTGLGALTPIGNNIEEYWNGLVNGVSGAAPITHFDASKFKTRFACEVKNFDVRDYIDRKEARKMDKFSQYAMIASDEAISDANFIAGGQHQPLSVSVGGVLFDQKMPFRDLYRGADQLLYRAKEIGRNRIEICVFDPHATTQSTVS